MSDIRKYVELIESYSRNNLPKYLFHGTQEHRIKDIQANGLLPSKTQSSGVGVYLTDDKFTAENYTLMHGDGNDAVVLKIDTTFIDPTYLKPDDYELIEYLDDPWNDTLDDYEFSEWDEVPWELSLEAVNQVIYTKSIPPEGITLL